MNTAYLEKWTTALRSGEYKQGKSALRRNADVTPAEGEPEKLYCCLGVLCDLVKDEVNGTWNSATNLFEIYNEQGVSAFSCSYLPDSVVDLVNLPQSDQVYLANKNDTGDSFIQIAKLIESQFKEKV